MSGPLLMVVDSAQPYWGARPRTIGHAVSAVWRCLRDCSGIIADPDDILDALRGDTIAGLLCDGSPGPTWGQIAALMHGDGALLDAAVQAMPRLHALIRSELGL